MAPRARRLSSISATAKSASVLRAELPFEAADPGQDPRTAPDIASLWSMLDLTPEGRGKDWYPKLSYWRELTPGCDPCSPRTSRQPSAVIASPRR